ncbi:hypothetical protein AAFF_G00101550, partial [Aldrovandia affinis]
MAAAMGEQLKRHLHAERPAKLSKPLRTSTPVDGSDSDATCASGSEDLFALKQKEKLMFLVNSTVQVRKRLFQRISNKRMTLFTQDLATLVFGRDTLAKSTLTGKGKKGDTKDQLDPVKVLAIIDTVRDKFPNAEVSEIRPCCAGSVTMR